MVLDVYPQRSSLSSFRVLICTDAVRRRTVHCGFNRMPHCNTSALTHCLSPKALIGSSPSARMVATLCVILRAKLANTRTESSKFELLVGIVTDPPDPVFSSSMCLWVRSNQCLPEGNKKMPVILADPFPSQRSLDL